MKGVILSGGKGSRLSPITDNYPKQLIPILGKPILAHCLDYMASAGIKDIAIIVGPDKGPTIEEEIKPYCKGLNVEFIYQDEPKGLAHAVGLARNFTKNEDFIVLLGDNLFDKRLSDLIERFYRTQADSLILLKDVTHPYNFGVVKFDECGKALKLVEKPKEFVSNYAIVGVYLFNQKIYQAIDMIEPSQRGELEITDAIALQVEQKQNIQTQILDSYWFDTGTREGLLDANCRMLLAENKQANLAENITESNIFGKVNIGKESFIDRSNLMGPIYIGKNVRITNSTIGPYTSIGDNCIIENAEIQSSIIMENTKVLESQSISSLVFKNTLMQKENMNISKLIMKPSELKLFASVKPQYLNSNNHAA
jgi:glucose-1-phosphate thymidylyltransferase